MMSRPVATNVLLLAVALSLSATPLLAKQREHVVYDFGRTTDDGTFPQDGLIADSAGNFYGTTISGGSFGKGGIFVVSPAGSETVVYSFAGAPNDGDQPNAALAIDAHGILYGTTMAGGASNDGIVFSFDPAHGREKLLYSFCTQPNCADGSVPIASLAVGKKSVLYGTTVLGGLGTVQQNSGVVFRLDPPPPHSQTWTESVLYNFCSLATCADGKNPSAGRLLLTKSGLLYGTAQAGQQGGTLYSVNASGGGYSLLHVFTTGGTNDGVSPKNGVVADKSGVLYGTTSAGGLHGCGTTYSYDPFAFNYQSLYSFCSQAGDPQTIYGGVTLVQKRSGVTLYGLSLAGGAYGHGAIYSLTPAGGTWDEHTLDSFCPHAGCKDGATPAFSTLLYANGSLYGTTTSGGIHGDGVVFRFGKN